MSLNRIEVVHYAVAESAALGIEVAGVMACPDCSGCGLKKKQGGRVTATLSSFKEKLMPKWLVRSSGISHPVYGVDICDKCKGSGRFVKSVENF